MTKTAGVGKRKEVLLECWVDEERLEKTPESWRISVIHLVLDDPPKL